LIKTFFLGLILGVAGAASLVYFWQAVDLQREPSLISVQPNDGNTETFYINLPQDRIFAARRSEDETSVFPPGIRWPEDRLLDGTADEIFKLRNSNDVVIGIAARMSNARETSGAFIQWMLHFPARGSMFLRMQLKPSEDGLRSGLLTAGTREFEVLNGTVSEYFNSDVADPEFDVSGRLELVLSLVGPLGEEE
jgi:hypothetical protein